MNIKKYLFFLFLITNSHSNASQSYAQLAQECIQQGKHQQAIECYTKILEQSPADIHTLFACGISHISLNQLEKAAQCFKRIIDIQPGVLSAIYNLAYTCRRIGKYHEALHYYQTIFKYDPLHEEAHFGAANAYLVLGDFEHGLNSYELGRKNSSRVETKLSHIGQLNGKTILILEEWGIGDTLHFIRYAKLFKKAGVAQVILACRPQLIPFLSMQPDIDKVIPLPQGYTYKTDYQIPMMSLMHACKTRMNTIPAHIPYLKADQNLIDYWHEKLKNDHNLKIGIFWESETRSEKNCPLHEFSPLFSMKGLSFYSLQKNFKQEMATFPQGTIRDFSNEIDVMHGSFMDTAALIKNLDLIITIDTSLAHLAGALGASTWLMLPRFADWRWFLDRNDSPWYPTMKLFRQTSSGDWKTVIEEIKKELKNLLKI
jgi:hypothetical protein